MSISYQLDTAAPTPVDNGTLSAIFDTPANESSLREVRVGYIGLCARTSFESWICDARPFNLVQALRNANQIDPLNLIWAGIKFQAEAVTSIFLCVLHLGNMQ